ncbi:MAG: FkbM family methyltransferase [Steroidobacteraceae bacterium]
MQIPWRKRVSRLLRARARMRVLAAHGLGLVAETKNGTLVVDARDFNVSRHLLERGEYDWAQVTLLASLVAPGARLVVVGAHIGSVLIPLARVAGAASTIAFEPSPRNRRLLELNLVLNGLAGLAVHASAVGEAAGLARFTENPINSGNSRVSARGEISVPIVTLDATLARDTRDIDLLVVDAEGYEVQVLRGARATLARTCALYVEYAPEQLAEQGCTVAEFAGLIGAAFAHAYTVRGARVEPIDGELARQLAAHSARGTRFDLLCLREPLGAVSANR